MKWFNKVKDNVKKAEADFDEKVTKAIDDAELDGTLREHKGVPLKDNRGRKK